MPFESQGDDPGPPRPQEADTTRSPLTRPPAPLHLPSDYSIQLPHGSTQPPSYHTGDVSTSLNEARSSVRQLSGSHSNEPSSGGPYTLIFSYAKHASSLTPLGATAPLYVASYKRPFAFSKPDILVSFAPKDYQLATVNFHSFSSKINLVFSEDRITTYKAHFPTTNIRAFQWTVKEGPKRSKAGIECFDQLKRPVCTISLTQNLTSGSLEVWKEVMEWDEFDRMIVSAIAQIEWLKRRLEIPIGTLHEAAASLGNAGGVAATT
ncbi:hypothetical protein H2204_001900 [Knufia peltigerae]|uniref:Uncharacterized protein n=1 Tax=Knufia peltigerae TaxID=1002370 RepID=A0AA38YDY6_9EURO|nr:hypothetical protein H2204_001900 [Knufia peltigerae]